MKKKKKIKKKQQQPKYFTNCFLVGVNITFLVARQCCVHHGRLVLACISFSKQLVWEKWYNEPHRCSYRASRTTNHASSQICQGTYPDLMEIVFVTTSTCYCMALDSTIYATLEASLFCCSFFPPLNSYSSGFCKRDSPHWRDFHGNLTVIVEHQICHIISGRKYLTLYYYVVSFLSQNKPLSSALANSTQGGGGEV